MLSNLARDSFVYGAATLLSRSTYLVLVPLLTHTLNPAQLGVLDILVVVIAVATVIVTLEVNQGLARFVPDTREQEERRALASSGLWFGLASLTAFAALIALLSPVASRLLFGSADHAPAILAATGSMWAGGVYTIVNNELRWELRPKGYVVSNVTFAAVALGAAFLLVGTAGLGVAGYFIAQSVGAVAGIVAAFSQRPSFGLSFDPAHLRRLMRFSAPLVISSLGVLATIYTDRVMVGAMLGLTDVGLFGVGYRVASIVLLLTVGFQLAITPLIYAEHQRPDTPREIAAVFRGMAGAGATLCLLLALFAEDIVQLISAESYVAGGLVVPFLAPALMLGAMTPLAPGLAIALKTKLIAKISVLAGVANALLNIALIPALGIRGAALATLLTAIASFGATMWFSQRQYRVPHQWLPLGVGLVAVTGAGFAATVISPSALANLPRLLALAFAVGVSVILWTSRERGPSTKVAP